MSADEGRKHLADAVLGQLRIWYACQLLEHELNILDDASLSDYGIARAQISKFVSAYPIAGALLDLILERLELAGDTAPMLRWTYEDLLRAHPMCTEHRPCRGRHFSRPMSEGNQDFCPNAWVLDQLKRLHNWHAMSFGAKFVSI